jgi:Zn-dependent protease
VKLLLMLLSAGKLGAILKTGGTMLLSMVVYAWIYGWQYAVGFVLLIFFHEMGHFLAAKQRGLNVSAPTFIPFVGAWIQLKDQPMNVETEAYVAFAGPVVGSAAALACYFYARATGSELMLALAYSGCMLNLFNLIPMSPLDGGRITAIISPRVWLLGVPLLAGLFFYRPSPMLILIAFMAYPQIKQALWPDKHNPQPEGYYNATINERINYGVLYLGLVAYLALMSFKLHEQLR